MSERYRYRDRQGNPITLLRWSQLDQDLNYRIVARDIVGTKTVITLWRGQWPYHPDGIGPMFSTATRVQRGEKVEYRDEEWHSDNETEAIAVHQARVQSLREGLS